MRHLLVRLICVATALVGGLASPATVAAAPDDPVVLEAHPPQTAEARDEQIAFTAEPLANDEPLRIYGPLRDAPEDDGAVTHEHTVVVQPAAPRPVWWLGLTVSPVLSPVPTTGTAQLGEDRLGSNRFRACLYPHRSVTCGVVKGFDFKLQLFSAAGTHDHPRLVGYLRTGYGAGRVDFEPREGGAVSGDPTTLEYLAVPVFLGGNAYLFKDSPVRVYGGLGVGADIVRLEAMRWQQGQTRDFSGRVGAELHAGVEGRISNIVALNAEVMQQWGHGRQLAGIPRFSTTGVSVLAGVTFSVPTAPMDRGGTSVVSRSSTTIGR